MREVRLSRCLKMLKNETLIANIGQNNCISKRKQKRRPRAGRRAPLPKSGVFADAPAFFDPGSPTPAFLDLATSPAPQPAPLHEEELEAAEEGELEEDWEEEVEEEFEDVEPDDALPEVRF